MIRKKRGEKLKKPTWYGVTAAIAIGPGFIHRAGWGNILIPHPPLVNWLLRLKLADRHRMALSTAHEFQHLQSAPIYLLYTMLMVAVVLLKDHVGYSDILIIFISSHAAWELISEALTIFYNDQLYSESYSNISIFPRLVFWVGCGVLSLIGWLLII